MLEYNYYLKCTAADTAYTNGSDHVLSGSDWVQFYPGINRDAVIEYDIANDRYRKRFNGNLVFVNRTQTDYTYISQIQSPSAEIDIRIEQVCGGTTASDWWEGYFSIIDGAWDSDRGIFSVTPAPDDAYRPLEEQGDKVFNIIPDIGGNDLAAKINYSVSTITLESLCTDFDFADFQLNNPGFPATENKPNDSWDYYAYCGDTGSTEGCISPDIYYHTWKKQVTPIKLNANYTYDEAEGAYSTGNCDAPATSVTFPARGFLLSSLIQGFLDDLSPGLVYKSSFFNNDDFGLDYLSNPGVTPTENYVLAVTNPTIASPNPLTQILLYQKSDTKRTSDAATKAEMSFNDLMQMLSNMFNVNWHIDPSGYFRIEHVSYYAREVDVDLKTSFPEWINATNKWSYQRENMPNREHFEFMESNGLDFIGKDIVYDRLATGNRYKDNQLDRVVPATTDAGYLYGLPDEVSNEGWALFQTSGSDYAIGNEVGAISSDTVINGHFSWANLHNNYWRHERVIEVGELNGESVTFETWQKNIKQVNVVYPDCCTTFDPNGLKTTHLGDGEVGEARYRLIDGTIDTVFFYLDVNTPDPPPVSTYYIKYSNEWDVLTGTLDKLIFYG